MMKIRLRAMEPEDLDLLYRIENDQTLWGVSTTNVPYSRYALHDYIAHSTGDIYIDHQVRLMIENEAGDIVGIIDLVNFDARHLRAEVGLVILSEYRKRGYAAASLDELSRYALLVLHLHQLYAIVDEANEASRALFRCVGWTSSVTLSQWLFDGREYHNAIVYQKILTS